MYRLCITGANIDVLSSGNIYTLLDELNEKLSAFMPSYSEEVVLGTAEIKQMFPAPRDYVGTCLPSCSLLQSIQLLRSRLAAPCTPLQVLLLVLSSRLASSNELRSSA